MTRTPCTGDILTDGGKHKPVALVQVANSYGDHAWYVGQVTDHTPEGDGPFRTRDEAYAFATRHGLLPKPGE